ncbi:YciI family protein [soil metagenome]
MKFMVLMIPGNKKAYEQGAMPEPALIEKMMKFNEDLVKAGVLLAGDGLHPSAKGARIDFTGGKASVTDGPFTEARELIGGYWLWQVKAKEEAIAWAKRCPAESGDQLELRQVFEPADFGPEVAEREGALIEAIAKGMAKNQGTSS